MRRKIAEAGERSGAAETARVWLRRVMPRVAWVAPVLLIAWLLLSGTSFYQDSLFGDLFGTLTCLVVALTVAYYGLRTLFWLKRKLLWRVRRRLMITYLFVGLTPIVLLGLLGLFAALVALGQAMTRIVAVEVNATEQQTLASALSLADSFARLPPNASDRDVQAWLDERTTLLQGSLPGVRAAVWRGRNEEGAGALGELGQSEAAHLLSGPDDARTRGVGEDARPLNAPLPGWLERRAEWSGFAFVPPREAEQPFGSPSLRALVRRNVGGRNLALLLVVPVSRALVEQYQAHAGLRLRPFFLGANDLEARAEGNQVNIKVAPEREGGAPLGSRVERDAERLGNANFSRDQFGEKIQGQPYIVVLPATNWLDGETGLRLSFVIGMSWREMRQQVFGNTEMGKFLHRLLTLTAACFLFLELIALFAAAWMTRAVTGTVHKLYRATEYIKRGDFSHRVRVRSRDQLGELAEAFNEMSSNIESLLDERVQRERLEREVEIAADVQAQLFPRSVPRLATLEIAGECRAARGVAGDYYDYIEVAPGLVAFALGDVSGKGISASLVMSNLQASLRAQTTIIAERLKKGARTLAATTVNAPSVSVSNGGERDAELPCGVTGIDEFCAVENMVESINTQLCRSTDANRFATLFLALYDEPARRLRYTNAGHNSPLLIRADGSLEPLEAGGTVIGAFDWSSYAEGQTQLEPGDLLLIFSDGITEANDAGGREYGEQRLADFAIARRRLSADELLLSIFQEIDNWSGAQERGDDQTLVILKAVEG